MEIQNWKSESYIINELHVTEVEKLNFETGTSPNCRKVCPIQKFPDVSILTLTPKAGATNVATSMLQSMMPVTNNEPRRRSHNRIEI